VALIGNPDYDDMTIIGLLGRIGEESIPYLKDIATGNESLAYFAIGALGNIGQAAESILIELTSNGTPYCRLHAAIVLGQGNEIGISTLKDLLDDNSAPLEVRLEAALALINYGDSEALSTLLVLLPSVGLHPIGPALVEMEVWRLLDDVITNRPEVKDQVITFLLAILYSVAYGPFTRGEAIRALAKVISVSYDETSQYLPIITNAASREDLEPYTRQNALEGLAEIAKDHPEIRDRALMIILRAMKNFGVDLIHSSFMSDFYFYSPVSALASILGGSDMSCETCELDDEVAAELIAIMNNSRRGRTNVVNLLSKCWFSSLSTEVADKLFGALKKVVRNHSELRQNATVALGYLWRSRPELAEQIIEFLRHYRNDPRILDVLCDRFSCHSDVSTSLAETLEITDTACQEHDEMRTREIERAFGVPPQ
jgi:hypothetical protein